MTGVFLIIAFITIDYFTPYFFYATYSILAYKMQVWINIQIALKFLLINVIAFFSLLINSIICLLAQSPKKKSLCTTILLKLK